MLVFFLILKTIILLSMYIVTIHKIIKHKTHLTILLCIVENGCKYQMSSFVNIKTSIDRIAVDIHDADLLCTIDTDYIIRYKEI